MAACCFAGSGGMPVYTRSHSAEDWKQVADGLTRVGVNGDAHFLTYDIAQDWVAANVMVKEAVADVRGLLDWTETILRR